MADIYKVAVGITLATNAAEVLGLMAGQLRGIDGQVQGLIGKWDSLGASMKSTLTGLTQIAGSVAIGDFLAKATAAGGELVKYQGQLANLGKSAADIKTDTDAAMQAQIMVHGTSAAENLKILRELSGVTATSEDARDILQSVLKSASVVSSMLGGSPSDYVQSMVKAAENRGDGVDPATGKISKDRLMAGVKAETAAIVAAGGLVTPQQMLGIIQQAGPMARMDTDPDKFYQGILSAAMDMTGQRAGTALTALGRQLLGGKMSKPTAEEMESIGLLHKNAWHKSGTGVVVDPGGLEGEDTLKGPGGMKAWMEGTLLPKLKAAGFNDQASQMQELYKVFGTETARRMAALFVTSQAQAEKDASLQRAAAGQDLFGNMMGTDIFANAGGLSSALNGLMQVLGTPMVKPAIAGLNAMTNAVNSLFGMFAAHPDAAGNTMGGLAAGGATLFGLGARNLYNGMFGENGIGGAGAKLSLAASQLSAAAAKLSGAAELEAAGGVKGGSKALSNLGGLITAIPGFIYAYGMFAAGDSDYRKAHPNGDGPSVFGRGGGAAGGPGRKRNPFAIGEPGVPDTGFVPNVDRPEFWYNPKGSQSVLDKMHWNGAPQAPLDLSKINLTMPPIEQKVEIKPAPVMLDGRVLAQLIQSAIVKAGSIVSGGQGFDGSAMPRAAGQ